MTSGLANHDFLCANNSGVWTVLCMLVAMESFSHRSAARYKLGQSHTWSQLKFASPPPPPPPPQLPLLSPSFLRPCCTHQYLPVGGRQTVSELKSDKNQSLTQQPRPLWGFPSLLLRAPKHDSTVGQQKQTHFFVEV